MLTDEQKAFLARAKALAQDVAPQFGVDWRVMTAAAILESGWGESRLAREAKNFFGITAPTQVDDDDVYVLRTAGGGRRFRRYGSDREAFEAYGRLVGGSSYYAEARASARRAFVRAMAPVYCPTDPDYSLKITQVMEMLDGA